METLLLASLDGLLGGLFGLLFGLAYFAFIGAMIYGNWRLYEKAGKPGWASLVPIYGTVVLHEIVGRDTVKMLLLFIPLVNIYFLITLHVSLAKSFGKHDVGDYILAVFFSPLSLGLGSATYVGPSEGPNASVVAPTF